MENEIGLEIKIENRNKIWVDFGISTLISILIHVITGIIGVIIPICTPCFYLHLIPFGYGFFGEPAIKTWIYYIIQILVIAFLVLFIRLVIRKAKRKNTDTMTLQK